LNGGSGSPGSTMTAVVSPHLPHCRVCFVGNLVIGLVAAAIAASACARSSALVSAGPRRWFMRAYL
jgi:hypothetical protein